MAMVRRLAAAFPSAEAGETRACELCGFPMRFNGVAWIHVGQKVRQPLVREERHADSEADESDQPSADHQI